MKGIVFPVKNDSMRRALAKENICPECGHETDTGWECNNRACGYDARLEAVACTNADVLVLLLAKYPKPERRHRYRDSRHQ